jgi:nucleoside-diphosphate-sugar epimerase
MNVLITGAGGFLGDRLARALAQRGFLRTAEGREEPIARLTLFDRAFPAQPCAAREDLVHRVRGDLADPAALGAVIDADTAVIFHLAAMVSGEGERDFDGCLRVNLDGTRHLLEAARATGRVPRVVFASSLAVFGGHTLTPVVSDRTKPLPQTTYGMTKLIGELLLADYSRKGWIDGRGARLPTIFIRPGRPNAAASSFASGLFREPLAGRMFALPVPRDQEVPLLGYRRLVANLVRLAECEAPWLGDDRTVTLPSTRHRVAEMIAALERVAAARGRVLGPIVDVPDATISAIVRGWPVGTDASRVPALGLETDPNVDEVIEHYLEDFGAD